MLGDSQSRPTATRSRRRWTPPRMDIGFDGSLRRRVDGALWYPFRVLKLLEPPSPERPTRPYETFLFSLGFHLPGGKVR